MQSKSSDSLLWYRSQFLDNAYSPLKRKLAYPTYSQTPIAVLNSHALPGSVPWAEPTAVNGDASLSLKFQSRQIILEQSTQGVRFPQ